MNFEARGSRCGGKTTVGADEPAATRTFFAPSECRPQLQPVTGPQREPIKLPECDFSDIVRRRNFFGPIKQLRKTPPGCAKRGCRENPLPLQADQCAAPFDQGGPPRNHFGFAQKLMSAGT